MATQLLFLSKPLQTRFLSVYPTLKPEKLKKAYISQWCSEYFDYIRQQIMIGNFSYLQLAFLLKKSFSQPFMIRAPPNKTLNTCDLYPVAVIILPSPVQS